MWTLRKLNSEQNDGCQRRGGGGVGGRGGRNGKVLVKGYKLLVMRLISFGDLMYSMVTIVNNAMLYTRKLLRV